ncbi:biotin/lipoyl-containing protein [Chitinophaga rhizophila]|uniref:Acetyl-CoA carboxylase biotin carboxyl carrier protein subunit n=1 Tax=Chitinophaga rhizophila TaxID=2866212 RepID=A0ABS7GM43_9BACT|nr:biotin/lipoyl-containing protein [Chitinophaga rhizophila]MBW8688395.1 acetyl-CoA carboxylase biotin carboxyl carrier protein subunit [Chitinophaga rhizophila]
MIKAIVNSDLSFKIDLEKHRVICDSQPVNWSDVPLPGGSHSVILDGKSFVAQVTKIDRDTKTVTIVIDQQEYEVVVEEPIDQLLAEMGMKDALNRKVNDLKAPMPGLVLKVLVEPGQAIKKGDPVLILEAMKMENVFKAAADAVVKEVKVKEKTAVEKGEVLVILE